MNCWSQNATAWQMTYCIYPDNLGILPGLVLKLFMAQEILFIFPCFLLSFHLEANSNSWHRPKTSTNKVDTQHLTSARSSYSQQYSISYKKFSNHKVLSGKIHEEKFMAKDPAWLWGADDIRVTSELRYRFLKIKIIFSSFFFWWLFFNLVTDVKEKQEALFQSNRLEIFFFHRSQFFIQPTKV